MRTENSGKRMFDQSCKNVTIDSHGFRNALWINFLWIGWAMWWGGLSFYAICVVPIATDLIGSIEQGFVTQRVMQWHNSISLIFVVCLAIDAFFQRRRVLWVVVAILSLIIIGLLVGHFILSSQMDFVQHTVPDGFYSQHAIYLWITACEWIIGMTIPFLFRSK